MLACPSGRFAQVSLREWVRLEGEWLGPWDSNPRPLFGSLRRVPRSRHSTTVLGSRSGCRPGRSSRAQSVGWMPRAAPSVEQWGRPVGVTVAPDARCWCPTTAATESGGLPRRPLRGDDDDRQPSRVSRLTDEAWPGFQRRETAPRLRCRATSDRDRQTRFDSEIRLQQHANPSTTYRHQRCEQFASLSIRFEPVK